MDHDHKLAAPNEDELKGIEQIQDRSELSGVYRSAQNQFEGELLSSKERDKAKADELEAITSGIGKYALRIGLYIPYPFVSGILLLVTFYSVVNLNSAIILVGLIILSIGAWLLSSYYAYSAIYKTFYKHALRAGPFLVVSLVSTLMAAQAFYGIVLQYYAIDSLIFNTALVSLLVIMYSIVTSFILLGIWGNSRLGSGVKAAVSGMIIAVSAFLVIASYLF